MRYLSSFNSKELEKEFFDLIIVGQGLAGLSAAFSASREKSKSIALIYAYPPNESSSSKAQGGIAAAIGKDDSAKLHIKDTLKVGEGLCNEKAVKILVKESIPKIKELIELGLEFDQGKKGVALGREGGHSRNRILHINGDETGKNLVQFMGKQVMEKGVNFLENNYLIDLIAEKNNYYGIVVENRNEKKIFYSNSLILATGGYASLYYNSSNSPYSIGEGLSVAKRANAELMDLEFVQFHPTTILGSGRETFLTTESVRGEGGKLVNERKERFIDELSPRDKVSRAIHEQMKKGPVYLDIRDFSRDYVEKRFPSFNQQLIELKINPEKDLIPVQPAAHYTIGGIKSDLKGRTNLKGIYSAGECSCFGAHGANRLPCNSLLEALVFGQIAGENAVKENKKEKINIKNEVMVKKKEIEIEKIKNEIEKIMWESCGIVRNGKQLEIGLKGLKKIEERVGFNEGIEFFQLKNMLLLSKMVLNSALKREESRGVHYRADFPGKSLKWKRHTII